MRKLFLASFEFNRTEHENTRKSETDEIFKDFRLVVVTKENVDQVKTTLASGNERSQLDLELDAAYRLAQQWFKKRYPDGRLIRGELFF